jgi:hypothetical protein
MCSKIFDNLLHSFFLCCLFVVGFSSYKGERREGGRVHASAHARWEGLGGFARLFF